MKLNYSCFKPRGTNTDEIATNAVQFALTLIKDLTRVL